MDKIWINMLNKNKNLSYLKKKLHTFFKHLHADKRIYIEIKIPSKPN